MTPEPSRLPSPSLPSAGPSSNKVLETILSELRDLRHWLLASAPSLSGPSESRSGTHQGAVAAFPKTRYKAKETSPFFENRVQVEHVLKEYFDKEEAADYLRTSPETIRRYARRKLLPFHQVGRRPVFSRADLDCFMRRQRRAPRWPAGPERRTGP